MDGAPEPVGRVEFPALGGLAVVLTTDPGALERAAEAVRDEVAAIDAACSRFRADSELSRVNAAAGTFVAVGPLFAEALDAALWAAEATAGDVDPTCGTALRELGYDMDFAQLPEVATLAADQGSVTETADGAAGWRAVEWDRDRGRVRVPVGTALDFGATAKALAADRAAARAAWAAGCGVLVSLSGDLAVRGPAPRGGWLVRVAEDHRAGDDGPGQTVTVAEGGMATSSTTVRAWAARIEGRPGRIAVHHIVDPRTGRPTDGCWRTATAAAASCLAANTVATATVVRGAPAANWLREIGVPARLVRRDGSVAVFGGWPVDGAIGAAAVAALPTSALPTSALPTSALPAGHTDPARAADRPTAPSATSPSTPAGDRP